MTECRTCGFVWNATFEPDRLVYDQFYENDQANSEVFRSHLHDRARHIIAALGPEPANIVEVGCGQGEFLKLLLEIGGSRIRSAIGFDPAWRGANHALPENVRIIPRYFTSESVSLLEAAPDTIVTRHTIEHIPDPIAFLTAIREASHDLKPARLFLETPCARWIVDNLQFQDFFFEHCSIFTAASLYHALKRTGFRTTRLEHVFGGQYLWAEGDPHAAEIAPPTEPPIDAERWKSERLDFIQRWRSIFEERCAHEPVYVWGVGAKGVTFSLLVDPDGVHLAGAVDINPKKQNLFIPITGLRVLSPEDLPCESLTIIAMNPNYLEEIRKQTGRLGSDVTLLSTTADDAGEFRQTLSRAL